MLRKRWAKEPYYCQSHTIVIFTVDREISTKSPNSCAKEHSAKISTKCPNFSCAEWFSRAFRARPLKVDCKIITRAERGERNAQMSPILPPKKPYNSAKKPRVGWVGCRALLWSNRALLWSNRALLQSKRALLRSNSRLFCRIILFCKKAASRL